MWASKWIIAVVSVGLDVVVDTVTSQIGFRLSSGNRGVSDSRVRGLTVNLSQWWDQPLTAMGGLRHDSPRSSSSAIAWRRRPGRTRANRRYAAGPPPSPSLGWYAAAEQSQPDPSPARLPLTPDRDSARLPPSGYVALRSPEPPRFAEPPLARLELTDEAGIRTPIDRDCSCSS